MFKMFKMFLMEEKKEIKPKILSIDNLPLRGFLKCPNC